MAFVESSGRPDEDTDLAPATHERRPSPAADARGAPGPTPTDPAGAEASTDAFDSLATRDEDPDVPGPVEPPASAAGIPVPPGYTILEELGRGGMGVVYRARQEGLNRLVALKMVRDQANAGPDQLERFRIEAEVVARLRHPHIIQVYEFGLAGGVPYFSLELLEGGNLADRVAGTPQAARSSAGLMATLAGAVHAAHRAGIVHRDLKPQNVLFDRDGHLKVADFGLAKRLEVQAGLSMSGEVMGTPHYMAPEQALGKNREVGPAADIYALGAIL
jgi:serine/threonine protein kinase